MEHVKSDDNQSTGKKRFVVAFPGLRSKADTMGNKKKRVKYERLFFLPWELT